MNETLLKVATSDWFAIPLLVITFCVVVYTLVMVGAQVAYEFWNRKEIKEGRQNERLARRYDTLPPIPGCD